MDLEAEIQRLSLLVLINNVQELDGIGIGALAKEEVHSPTHIN